MLKGDDKTRFVIKRQNTYMCFSTTNLKFLDVTQYLAPGVSYDKYLKAYGCELQKGYFPYEYVDDLHKLEDRILPPQSAFFSRLKNEGISNDDYARCQAVWRDNGMETLREYLIWYNNRDVVPFLDAIAKQFAFYHDRGIDMFKDGISVPGLSLLHLFNDLPNDTFFTIFNQTNSDLHKLVKDNIVGGPAIIFHRYHEKGITKIRGGSELCRKIVGYDANALYLWAIKQDMPTGWYTRRREEKRFQPQQAQPYGQMAVQWLTWEATKNGCLCNLFFTTMSLNVCWVQFPVFPESTLTISTVLFMTTFASRVSMSPLSSRNGYPIFSNVANRDRRSLENVICVPWHCSLCFSVIARWIADTGFKLKQHTCNFIYLSMACGHSVCQTGSTSVTLVEYIDLLVALLTSLAEKIVIVF